MKSVAIIFQTTIIAKTKMRTTATRAIRYHLSLAEKHVPIQPVSRMRPENEMLKTTRSEKRK
jgi:hypothetical protein